MTRYGGLREARFTDDSPEFFKVFLPYTSSHQISIPEAFVKNFKRVVPKKAILFDHSKKHWPVELEQTDGRLFFKKGWQDFARDHWLEFGDFLVFKCQENSRFEVKIFSKNGCEKELAMDRTISSSQGSKPKKACSKAHVGKRKHLKTGSQKGEEAGCSSKVGSCKSQKTVKTNLEEHKILQNTHFVTPKKPHFVRTIYNSSKRHVLLPKLILRSFNIRVMPNVIMHCQNGSTWSMNVNFHGNGKIFIGKGWRAFIKENNVKVGDKCIFEFVLGVKNICNELHVQIVRGNT